MRVARWAAGGVRGPDLRHPQGRRTLPGHQPAQTGSQDLQDVLSGLPARPSGLSWGGDDINS